MQINVMQILTDLDGKDIHNPVRNGETIEAIPVTLRYVFLEALLGMDQDEKGLSGADRYARYKLAEKIKEGDRVEVSIEEIKMMKDVAGKKFTPLVVGRVWDILEGRG